MVIAGERTGNRPTATALIDSECAFDHQALMPATAVPVRRSHLSLADGNPHLHTETIMVRLVMAAPPFHPLPAWFPSHSICGLALLRLILQAQRCLLPASCNHWCPQNKAPSHKD